MNCFFCCKILPKEEPCHPNDDKEDTADVNNSSTEIFDSNNGNLNGVPSHQSVLQISHFLNIPRDKIVAQKQIVNLNDAINCCQDCKETSTKLGDLCGLLEITQMKINYYLNLLTDQILKKDEYLEHQLVQLSSFQEIFHHKCLNKLAKINSNPVLQLTKVELRPRHDCTSEVYSPEEETDNYDDQIYNTTTIPNEYVDKPVDAQKYRTNLKSRKFVCDFCPVTFNNVKLKIRHIKASHMQKKDSRRHLIKACEYCGAMMSTGHLSAHKRNIHGISRGNANRETDQSVLERKYVRCNCGQVVRDKNMKAHKLKCGGNVRVLRSIYGSHKDRPPVKCDICYKLISYQNISSHKRRIHGIVSKARGTLPEYLNRKKLKKCEFCGKMVSSRNFGRHQRMVCGGGRINKKGRGDEGVEESSLVKCCEFCGKGVLRDKIDEHERLWCEVKKGMKDLEELDDLEREENLKCGGCGEMFECGTDLRLHLKESKECNIKCELVE